MDGMYLYVYFNGSADSIWPLYENVQDWGTLI